MLVTLRGKTGWREVEVGRGSSDATCPVVAVETWIKFAKLAKGPLFRRVTGKGKDVGPDRLNDRQVARLVKAAALAAGVRGDLSEKDRALKFSGHSLRAGLASSAEVDERYVQKTAWPCQRGNDPQISAPARPLPGQSNQGIRAVTGPCPILVA